MGPKQAVFFFVALLGAGCASEAGTEDDLGRRSAPTTLPVFGAQVSFELDHVAAFPLEGPAREGSITVTPDTESLHASVLAMDEDRGEALPLDLLLATYALDAQATLSTEGGFVQTVTGTPLLTEIEFGLDGIALPPGERVSFDLAIGGVPVGGGEVIYAPLAGDANLDGAFDSGDLVEVLQHGLYETGEPATFIQGDWNHDGVFDSSDIVAAQITGRYEQPALALPHAPDLVARDYPPFWLIDGTSDDDLWDRLSDLDDAIEEGTLPAEEAEEAESHREWLDRILYEGSTDPRVHAGNADFQNPVGTYVLCYLRYSPLGDGPTWTREQRTTGTCDVTHDDNCLSSPGSMATECGPRYPRLDYPNVQGWRSGIDYQYLACGSGYGGAEVEAECEMEGRVALFCETYQAPPAPGTRPARDSDLARNLCEYRVSTSARIGAAVSFSRSVGSSVAAGAGVTGRFAIPGVEGAQPFVARISPTERVIDGLGLAAVLEASDPPPDGESACTDEALDILRTSKVTLTCQTTLVTGVSTRQGWEWECNLAVSGEISFGGGYDTLVACASEAWELLRSDGDPVDRGEVNASHFVSAFEDFPIRLHDVPPVQELGRLSIQAASELRASRASAGRNVVGSSSEVSADARVAATLRIRGEDGPLDVVCMTDRPSALRDGAWRDRSEEVIPAFRWGTYVALECSADSLTL